MSKKNSVFKTKGAPSGDGSIYKVGIGAQDDTQWFNFQYQFLGAAGATSTYAVWDLNGISSLDGGVSTNISPQDFITDNDGDYAGIFPDFDTSTRKFNSPTQIIASGVVVTLSGGAAAAAGGWGFDIRGTTTARQAFGAAGLAVCFARDDTTEAWFAHTSNGATFTDTAISMPDGKHVLRIEYDPANVTPQARFYIDGIQVAINTTNIPSASSAVMGFTMGNGGGAGDQAFNVLSAPSFAVEI